MSIRLKRAAVTLRVAAFTLLVAGCRDERPTAPGTSPGSAPTPLTVSATAEILVGAGDIATCSNDRDELTTQLLDGIAGTVFTAGDNAYDNGSATDYANCYTPTWGRHIARTRPAPGDRDYNTAGAAGYFGYFGAAAGDPAKGYYSYDLGEWHIVVLNSQLSMSVGSAQEAWLKNDLAGSTRQCTLAYWHVPRFFSSGSSGINSSVKPLWDDLYARGVELVVNAHYRFYERYAAQTPDGVADAPYGIREFVVGTGGGGTTSFGTIRPNSEARSTGKGVLKLMLDAGSYAWEFVPAAGTTFTDTGSGTCHGAKPPVANPGGPYRSDGTVPFDGSGSSDPQGDTPLSYAWDFGDGSSGTGVKPVHTYSSDGSFTVTLSVTDSKGDVSAPATTTATIAMIVQAGPDKRTHPGEVVNLSVSFKDPGPNAPWSYAVDWGDGTQDNGSVTTSTDPIAASHSYGAVGQYAVSVAVSEPGGRSGSDELAVLVRDPGTPEVVVAAGDISLCTSDRDELTARLLDGIEGTVFTIGDNAYPDGSAADYQNCYEPTWGRHKDRTYATLGNHEYTLGNADPSFDYYASGIGPRGKGYYSLDLGDWHIIVLNDNSGFVRFKAGSEQDLWLQQDLARNTKLCTLAMWHGPYYRSASDGTSISSQRKILWDRLYAAGADLVLGGHYHFYERFAPQTPDGVLDLERGIREIVAGTGGGGAQQPGPAAPNSEVRAKTTGVLKLTLYAEHYDWQFVPIPGDTFTDSGSSTCH